MNKNEYENKRRALFEYQHLVRRLDQKCMEAGQWTSMAAGSGRGFLSSGGKGRGSSITDTAITIQQEVEELANHTMVMRERLLSAIGALPDEQMRVLMEARYINGLPSNQIAERFGYSIRQTNRLLMVGTLKIQW